MTSQIPATTRSRHILALVVSLIAVAVVAALGGLASAGAASEYGRLTQPDWAPPPNVFGPVWTVLYALMAIAAWLVWRADSRFGNPAIILYAAQLILNLVWSPLFFGLGWRGVALADILLLDVVLAATIALFWKANRTAAALLIPYFAWSLFATVLNYSVWSLNS
ncbi:tryptophan-rich sensory protein [Mycobacterium crocinum]|uniref:Tryptophan-rich sensory protein n=2 Tax=Mycolicibacterium TaxID=1866885 RepID=A0ABX8VGP3_9MYCO|nr:MULTISPECIES: TspO/MBR family protein [Mycolicibacterium]MCV7214786.1 tryptophan-rich sensory protein [Mycolicibacterium crocinum]QYL16961.1 tryptophan-rich sensory protein [Mycolicibacterium pallens]ULN41532.1 tryptophan-rich sensory protein [Mycolicibacterium crocinum]